MKHRPSTRTLPLLLLAAFSPGAGLGLLARLDGGSWVPTAVTFWVFGGLGVLTYLAS